MFCKNKLRQVSVINYLCLISLTSSLLFEHCASYEFSDVEFIESNNHKFDVLIFTQRWPITSCLEWMEEKQNNVCLLPSQKGIWTIHGIWPTRFGSIGPAFCNKSAEFDVNTLQPFREQLQQYWLNIEKGTPTESLWKHEWLKHGTCALVLPELSTENKYFGQGLAWLQQYSMSPLLAKSGVLPDKRFNVKQFNSAIKNTLNKNPSIHCIKDRETGDTYLSEIRICFSKQLDLVDCDGVMNLGLTEGSLTNCPADTLINYPSVLPSYLLDRITPEAPPFNWRTPLVNFYKLIQLIKWFTL